MMKLPEWATRDGNIVYVDGDTAYEEWLTLLGTPKLDRYWLEVAYQCIKLDVQAASGGPRAGIEIRLKVSPEGKAKYTQADKPYGKGDRLATRGLEARGHYARVRGFLPA